MNQKNLFPKKQKKLNSLLWLYEPLDEDPRFVRRKFFFFDAVYFDERLYLGLVDREEPWSGLVVCTAHEHHASLQVDFPQLAPHTVLGKWLYLSRSHPEFESVAQALVVLTAKLDRRLGVESEKRKRSARKTGK